MSAYVLYVTLKNGDRYEKWSMNFNAASDEEASKKAWEKLESSVVAQFADMVIVYKDRVGGAVVEAYSL